MIAELLILLLETTLATSFAAALVLLLRRPVRRVVGARGAYALWLLLPVAGLAMMIPARTVTLTTSPVASFSLVPIQTIPPGDVELPFDAQPLLIALWIAGAVGLALVLGWQQRRFRHALGRLRTRADGSWQADNVEAGPAVIGLLRGRIVLPADFDSRYTDLERDLVLRHERVHLERRDPLANLAAAGLRCFYWFNPLLHYAAGRFRFDQELAVDAAVLAQRPEARRSYADAMLKTQLMLDPPPFGCHWQSAHPLKERIAMLKHPLPSAARIAAGFAFALVLSASTGYVAWASQPTQIVAGSDADASQSQPARESLSERKMKPPRYPQDAIERGVGGKVVMKVEVSAEGKVLQAELDREASSPDIDASLVGAALDQVKTWSFEPARDADGKPQTGWVSVPVTFSITEDESASSLPTPPPRLVAAEEAATPLPTYRSIRPPKYPQLAIEQKREGNVFLRVLVGVDGMVQQVEVETSSGSGDLDEAAKAAVRKWTFNAAHDGYKSVAAWVGVPVNFSLDDAPASTSSPAPSHALEEIYIRGAADQVGAAPTTSPGWNGPGVDRWLDRISSPTDADHAVSLMEAANETPNC